jgi:hypothetical protein
MPGNPPEWVRPEAATLVRELSAFQLTATVSAEEELGGWREGMHDDLVPAVAWPAGSASMPYPDSSYGVTGTAGLRAHPSHA